MTQYNSSNVKLSNSQLNKLKSAIKNETDVVLRLSANMIGNSDNETDFPHKLLLTNRQVTNLRKALANYLSTDIKLSKTQLSKMIQSGGFLGRYLSPLLKTELSLMKNVIQPLANSVLIPLRLTAAVSAADPGIHKKIDEIKNILEIFKSLEDSGILLEGISETIKKRNKRIVYKIKVYKNNIILLSKVGENTKSINPQVSKVINGGTIILSKCASCGDKKIKIY